MNKLDIVWWGYNNNWGDILNPYLAEKISNREINRIPLTNDTGVFRYYIIGSILNYTLSGNYEVWGSGMDNPKIGLQSPPKRIHAVRGPLTRKVIRKQGYECPPIYGDPALLLPRFYTPNVKKKYKYGIIPHFLHKQHPWLSKFKDDPTVKIIDIQDPNVTNFIDLVNECEIILSSSLHGIMCGDAYGIPSYWLDLSPDGKYNWFKFNDYLMSVRRPLVSPIKVNDNTELDNLWPPLYNYSIEIDLDKLLDVCPFNITNKDDEN